jgi:hypothetical protein
VESCCRFYFSYNNHPRRENFIIEPKLILPGMVSETTRERSAKNVSELTTKILIAAADSNTLGDSLLAWIEL